MKYDVFISHSHKDAVAVKWLEDLFDANGITYWVDHNNLQAGDAYHVNIESAIKYECRFVVVLLTKNSMQKVDKGDMNWVRAEMQLALNTLGTKAVIPLLFADFVGSGFEAMLSEVNALNIYKQGSSAVDQMLRQIKSFSGDEQINISSKQTRFWGGIRKEYNSKTLALKILNVILWILFLPIMLMIKVCRSKSFGIAAKIFLCLLLLNLLGAWMSMWAFGIASLTGKPGSPAGGSGSQSSYEDGVKELTPIDIDIEELVTPFIRGYNNFGYFDGTVSREGTVDTADGAFSYKFDFTELRDGAVYFKVSIDKDASAIGDAVISAKCNSLLSNEEILEFTVSGEIDGCEIKLNNNKFRISTLKTDEFERSDPKDYFVMNKVREEFFNIYYYRFEILQSEYVVGTKTVKLSVIEDKRPGAEYVQPGLQFEVYEDGELLGQGRYIFTSEKYGTSTIEYNAENDDYKAIYADLAPDFDQAELLGETGILFNFDTRNYP